jgi:hypothetical protein
MPLVHKKETFFLTESTENVSKMCDLLEALLFHGIRVKEFQSIPFWAFLERLEVINPPNVALRNSMGIIAGIPNLHTPLSKARAWIRQALNNKCLGDCLQYMISQTLVLTKFYSPEALLRCPEDAAILVRNP